MYEDYLLIPTKNILSAYKQAILESDFLLLDGIALQIFYAIAAKLKRIITPKARLDNLNGTDFCPYFLDQLKKKEGTENVQLFLYGTYPGILEKVKTFFTEKDYHVAYAQDGYRNFDWEEVERIRKLKRRKYAVLIIARSTPEYPIQELWAWSNREKLKELGFLIFTQAGTFDFRAGVQKRAPKAWRKLKLERLWRVITDPKRNRKKVLDTLKVCTVIWNHLLLKMK